MPKYIINPPTTSPQAKFVVTADGQTYPTGTPVDISAEEKKNVEASFEGIEVETYKQGNNTEGDGQ